MRSHLLPPSVESRRAQNVPRLLERIRNLLIGAARRLRRRFVLERIRHRVSVPVALACHPADLIRADRER